MKIVSIFLFLMIASFGNSQNQASYSQFNLVKSLVNPGALATDAIFTADLLYRNQWAGVEGAPTTAGLNAAYELRDDMAVGLTANHDQIGLSQNTSIMANYAYRLIYGERNYLAFGVGAGVDNTVSNLAEAKTTVLNDPAFALSTSSFKFNASFGIYYRTNNFYIGGSVPRLLQNNLGGSRDGFKTSGLHYVAMSGYFFELSKRFVFNPNAQIKAAINTPIQADINFRSMIDNFSFTLGYRTENSLIAGIDYTFINKIRLGYSINYDLGPIARTKGFSHEVYIGMGLPYYFFTQSFDDRKYVNRKGGPKGNYRRKYMRMIKKA